MGIVTGNPIRSEFAEIGEAPGGERLSLLIFGGSRGARSINRAMAGALELLARFGRPPRIVHQTGAEDEPAVREAYRRYPEELYEVLAFIEDMPARLAAADLVICRAGASTLAELTAAGRPAILIPYPHAADDHQRHNAETVRTSGAAIVIRDDELDGGRLAKHVQELAFDKERMTAMGRAARRQAMPDAARRIADVAELLIAGNRKEGGADVP
jgi:UDP-N-acetylglucosamine--N-acetylmuramyl-(pentapeptide) pyrophosphoryl-undecaprenol N-acetylglucosamine transferase